MAHGWTTVRVFISSTFHDMHAERNHLVRFTFPELQERMAERHLHLRPIDLRWGVPAEEEALDVCLDAIDECRPFFIGLLGSRYGDRMPGTDRSMAALEIAHGVLDHPEGMIPFFYFRDPEVAADIPPPHRSFYNETDEAARARLDDLKRQIRDAGFRPRPYTCRWDGERNELVGLDSLGQAVLEDLWPAISERHPEGHDAAEEEDSEARDALEAFVESRVQHFSGRSSYLEELHAYVRGRLAGAGAGRGMVCVTGEPGVGKSSLLGKLARECAEAHPQAIIFSHFVGADASSTQVQPLLSRLWTELAREAGLREEPPRDARDLARELSSFLGRAAQVRPVCLILDGVDQLDPPDLHWLPEEPPARVAVVLSALEGEALAALRARRKPPVERVLGPLTKKEARDIVRDYLRQHLRKLSPRQIDALLSKPATRNPLYLLVALEELRVTGWFETLDEQIVGIPPDLPALFEELLDRLEGEHGTELVRSFLSLIAIGRGGQPEEDLRAMVEEPRAVTDLAWVRLLRSLRFYLLRRGERVDLFHRQLRLAIERRYLAEEARRECHRRAARYLQGRGVEYLRSVRELPFHLAGGGMREELYALLEDEGFRRRKLEATGSVHEICADLGLGLDAALAGRDLARTARFGFLHADYSEGRVATPDLLELHLRDRRAALREARLLRERPRFRVLLLLALEDAGAAGTAAADEVVAEALSLGGIGLPDGEAPFVGDVVAALLSAGCAEAWRLLRHALAPSVAARTAAGVSSRVPAPARAPLLGSAVAWLRQDFVDNPGANKPVDAFTAVAEEIAGLEDRDERERLVRELEALTTDARTPLEAAETELEIVIVFAALSFLASEAPTERAGRAEPRCAAEIRIALRAELGAILACRGFRQEGERLLKQAIEECREKAISPTSFGTVARVLRKLPDQPPRELFTLLLGQLRSSDLVRDLNGILEALADDAGGPGALDLAQIVCARVMSLGMWRGSALNTELVRVFARAGCPELARRHANLLPLVHLSLMARNPLLKKKERLSAIRGSVELAALARERDSEWVRSWLRWLGHGAAQLSSDDEKSKEFLELFDVCVRVGVSDEISVLLPEVSRFNEESVRARMLEEALDAARFIPADSRARLRGSILDSLDLAGGERARCRVLIQWLATATATDLQRFPEVHRRAEAVSEHEQRAMVLGGLAAALARFGCGKDAREIWYFTALAEQEGARISSAFAARVTAATRGPQEAPWQAVLAAVGCPDPDFALRVTKWAAAACASAERLEALEEAVSRLEWLQLRSRQLFGMHLALVHAWDRFGDPGRGARLALRALARRRGELLRDEERTSVFEIGRSLADHPCGRFFLLRLLSLLFQSSRLDARQVAELTQCLIDTPDEPWARAVFHELHRAVLERRFHGEWRRVDALASIATGLARRGHGELAHELLRRVSLDVETSSDDEFLQPGARAGALARLGCAYGEVFRTTGDPTARSLARDQLMEAADAASTVKGAVFGHESCATLVTAWIEALRLDLREAAGLEQRAQQSARELAHHSNFGSSWDGLRDLARARLGLGKREEALAVLGEVTNEARREELIADLLGRNAPGIQELDLLGWRQLSSGHGRRRAAEIVAERRLRPEPRPVVSTSAQAEESKRLIGRGGRISAILSFAAVVSSYLATACLIGCLLYWSLFGPYVALGRSGLSGVALMLGYLTYAIEENRRKPTIYRRLGLALLVVLGFPLSLVYGVTRRLSAKRSRWKLARKGGALSALVTFAAIGVSYWATVLLFKYLLLTFPWTSLAGAIVLVLGYIAYASREKESSIPQRLMHPPLILLALPTYFVYWLVKKLGHWRCMITLAQLRVRERLWGTVHHRPGLSGRQAPEDRLVFARLLRATAGETECFDLLLASELCCAAPDEAAAALEQTPPLSVPVEAPEEIVKLERQIDEARRSSPRVVRRAWQAMSKIGTRVGLALTIALVYVPFAALHSILQSRRSRQARRLAIRGGHLAFRAGEGISLLKHAIELEPHIPHFWHDYAFVLAEEGRADEALAAYRKAAELAYGAPIEPELWCALGNALRRARRDEDALEAFDRALVIAAPGSLEQINAERGRGYCLQSLGRRVA